MLIDIKVFCWGKIKKGSQLQHNPRNLFFEIPLLRLNKVLAGCQNVTEIPKLFYFPL
jgi:hypothetical protein